MSDNTGDHGAAVIERAMDLNPENDLDYLLGLAGEALADEDAFDSDAGRARWVVAQWCQEIGYTPDIQEFEVGEFIARGQQPDGRDLTQRQKDKTSYDCGDSRHPMYTPLQKYAATISGKLSLDATAKPELSAVQVIASEAALEDNCERLKEAGFDARIDYDHEPTRLLIKPQANDPSPMSRTRADGGEAR